MANITIHFEISNEHLIAALLQWQKEKETPTKTLKLSPQRVQAMKDAGVWDDLEKRLEAIRKYQKFDAIPKRKVSRLRKSLEAKPKTANAPWGLKKDGTPKKRPGRAPKGAK